ncbi:hypothetical protein [Actinacidiphila oryziradicis]|uniref:hypothetical protein n=1 Tax=Actinacidiphila oryziradicis TaxID=2571141 RepID=UPI0023F00AB9|nr:hypothetical protein [Actinacidiphila oryziradicis]MCW2870104.1 putative secreted protein [Actinacidiphila oryziradicis]
MDATTLGAVLACVGVLSGSVVAFLGKRGDTAVTRFNSVTDQVQEERNRAAELLATAQAELVALHAQRHEDLVEMTRLQIRIAHLEGDHGDPD